MKAACVCILFFAVISCKEGGSKNAVNNNDLPPKTKVAKNRVTNTATTSQVWKRSGRSDSRMSKLDLGSLKKLLDEIASKRYSDSEKSEFELAIGELASRDPEAAMAYYIPQNMRPTEPGFAFVVSLLAETSPDLLKDWLKNDLQNGPLGVRAECLRIALEGLANVDSASALDFYKQGKWDNAGKSDAINSIFLCWARKSTEEAKIAALKSFSGEDLDRALYNIILVAKSADPKSAMDLTKEITDYSSRGQAVSMIFSSWMESDPDFALKQLKVFDTPELQNLLISGLSGGVESSLVHKLAVNYPGQFIDLLQTLVPSSANEILFRSAVLSLSPKSPDSIIGLLESLPESSLKGSLIGTHFSVLARESPSAVVNQIGKIKNEASKMEAYKAIGEITNASNYESFLASVGELTERQKREFMAAAIPGISRSDPKMAADMLTRNEIPINDERRSQLLTTVALKLAGSDASYADKWMKDLPEDQQPFAMRGIAEEMARRDIKKLSENLVGAPRNENWKAGVRVLISNLWSSDPVMAKSWQESLDAQEIK